MTVEKQEVWGAAPTRPPAWSIRTTLVALGIAVVLAVGAGLVVYVVSGDSHSRAGHTGGPPGLGGGPGFGGPGENGRTLHGESVVSDGKGGFTTQLTQTGSLTTASEASVTVRSEDGYTRSYALTADPRQPHQQLQNGQQVTVRATLVPGAPNGAADATAVLPAR